MSTIPFQQNFNVPIYDFEDADLGGAAGESGDPGLQAEREPW